MARKGNTTQGATVAVSANGRTVTVRGAAGREARTLAQRAVGTVAVGTPTVSADGALTYTLTEAALAARKTVRTVPPASTLAAPARKPRKAAATDGPGNGAAAQAMRAALRAAGLTSAQLDLVVPLLVGANAVPAPAKREREVPAFLRKGEHTCETCRDLGWVRGVGADAGQPYKTANGVKAAREGGRAVKCPTHRKARKAA